MISYRQMLHFHRDLIPLHQQSSQEVIVVDLPHDSFLVDHVHHGGGDGLAVGQRWETLHSRLCVKGRHSKYSTEFRDAHLSRSWNGVTRVICFMRKFYYWFPPRLMRVKRFNGDKHPRAPADLERHCRRCRWSGTYIVWNGWSYCIGAEYSPSEMGANLHCDWLTSKSSLVSSKDQEVDDN